MSLHRPSPARMDKVGSRLIVVATTIVGSAISRPWSNRTALFSRVYGWKTLHPRLVERCPLVHPPYVFLVPCNVVHGSPTAHVLVRLVLLPLIPMRVGSHNRRTYDAKMAPTSLLVVEDGKVRTLLFDQCEGITKALSAKMAIATRLLMEVRPRKCFLQNVASQCKNLVRPVRFLDGCVPCIPNLQGASLTRA